MAIPPGNVTPVWPPSGFALAAVLIYGRGMWPGIFLGAFLVNTQAFFDITSLTAFINAMLAGLAIGAGSLLQPIFGSWLLKRRLEKTALFETPNAFLFFSLTTPFICLVSSSIGTASLFLAKESAGAECLRIWTTWWLGDSLGIILVTPLLLMARELKPRINLKPKVLVSYVALILTTLFSFGVFFTGSVSHYPLAFLSLPILLIFSFQFSRFDTMLAVILLACLTTLLTYFGEGQFVVNNLNTSLLLLQSFIAITAVTTMTFSILSHRHNQTEKLLREENHQRSMSEIELLNLKRNLEEKVTQRTEELILAKNLAEQLARTDPLTDMKNRRAFFEQYQYIYNLANRHEQTLALMIIDIDHFKIINDTYGHEFGDHVLRLIANVILNTIRESEISARLGGEEFVVLIPQTDAHHATFLAEKIRTNIEENEVRFEGKRVPVTASIGITQHNRKETESMKSILSRADKALYMAKTQGRNRVCKL
ncbi:MAG: diguanylate cyclase [Pseudomonadales bacterium]|nr:diguanylate cyclase [Pseudomonadales bacterium]